MTTHQRSKTAHAPNAELVPGSFYDGRKHVRKECHKDEMRLRKRAIEDPDDGPDFEVVETFIPQKQDHLYVIQNSRISDEKKVGRSHDPEQRAKELGKSRNFKMQILKVFHCQGHLEATVHKRLKARKVTEGDGVEWFRIDMQTLDMIIAGVIAESQL